MARITVEDCLKKENNRFALVVLASRRAKQLLCGAKSVLEDCKNKATVTALREIAAGDVRFMTPEELARVKEAEKKEYTTLSQQQVASDAVNAANELFFNSSKDMSDLESEFESLDLDSDEYDEKEEGEDLGEDDDKEDGDF